jgi:hypothetical protein
MELSIKDSKAQRGSARQPNPTIGDGWPTTLDPFPRIFRKAGDAGSVRELAATGSGVLPMTPFYVQYG